MLRLRAWLACLAAVSIGSALLGPGAALADHACDASIADVGWKVVPSHETVDVKDSAPFQSGNDWFVNRTTTTLPLCNYVNAAGSYSLRSYSLSPEDRDGARHDLQGRDAGRALQGALSAEIARLSRCAAAA